MGHLSERSELYPVSSALSILLRAVVHPPCDPQARSRRPSLAGRHNDKHLSHKDLVKIYIFMYNPKLGVLCSALTSAEAAKGSFFGSMAAKRAVQRLIIRAARTDGKARWPVQINGGRKVTRREAREHCFKMLFCQDFYPAEEKEEQLERYFEARRRM